MAEAPVVVLHLSPFAPQLFVSLVLHALPSKYCVFEQFKAWQPLWSELADVLAGHVVHAEAVPPAEYC